MEEKLDVTPPAPVLSSDSKPLQKPSTVRKFGWGKLILIIIVIILAIAGFSYLITPKESTNTTPTPTGTSQKPDWLTYQENIGDFTLQYPKGYTVSKTDMTSIQVLSPNIPAINTNFTLGIKYKGIIPSQTMPQLITKNKPCPAITPQGGQHSTLNGKMEAEVYVDTPCGEVTSTVVYTIHKDKLYIITIDSTAKFSEVKPYVDPIIATFQYTQN